MTYYCTSYYSLSPSDLEHHGIKGMHWGVRRFQNKDGSLTAKGRKRYDPKAGTTRSMLMPEGKRREPWSEKNDAPQPWSEKPSAKKQSAADRILYGKQKLNKDGTVKSTTANDILSKWDRQEKTQKAVSTGVQAYRALHHIYNFAKVAQGNYQQNTNRGREYYERMARRRGATNITWLD